MKYSSCRWWWLRLLHQIYWYKKYRTSKSAQHPKYCSASYKQYLVSHSHLGLIDEIGVFCAQENKYLPCFFVSNWNGFFASLTMPANSHVVAIFDDGLYRINEVWSNADCPIKFHHALVRSALGISEIMLVSAIQIFSSNTPAWYWLKANSRRVRAKIKRESNWTFSSNVISVELSIMRTLSCGYCTQTDCLNCALSKRLCRDWLLIVSVLYWVWIARHRRAIKIAIELTISAIDGDFVQLALFMISSAVWWFHSVILHRSIWARCSLFRCNSVQCVISIIGI